MTPARTVPHKAIRTARTKADKLGVTAVCRRPPGPLGSLEGGPGPSGLPIGQRLLSVGGAAGPGRPTCAHAQARPRKRRRR
ncbi:hypothetical protein MRX96_019907 [Rhipicephalus microplus]